MKQFIIEVEEVIGDCMDCCFRAIDDCPEDDCRVDEDTIYAITKIKSVDNIISKKK